jgi:hypothetical protein
MPTLVTALGQDEAAVRQTLWNQYHPESFWYLCMGIGLASTLALVGYHFWLLAEASKTRDPSPR